MEVITLPRLVRVLLLKCDRCPKVIDTEHSKEVLYHTLEGDLCASCVAHLDE